MDERLRACRGPRSESGGEKLKEKERKSWIKNHKRRKEQRNNNMHLSRRRASPPMLAPLTLFILCVPLLMLSTSSSNAAPLDESSSSGYSIERLNPRLDALLAYAAPVVVEVLSSGRLWTEGPVFWPSEDALLFSDVRDNAIYSWRDDGAKAAATTSEKKKGESEGATGFVSELVRPSGWLSRDEQPKMWEPGSNGLALDAFGNLVAAQHGERQVARVPLSELGGARKEENGDNKTVRFRAVASTFEGRRFNSPNDLAFNPLNGDLWFTDPVFGLEKYGDDPKRELPFQGVFRIPAAAYREAVAGGGEGEGGEKERPAATADSAVTLEISALSSPNGLAFSSDGKTLFVSNSGKEASFWASFDIDPVSGRVVKKKKKKNNKDESVNNNNNNDNGTCPDSSLSSSSLLPSLEEDGGKKLWDVTEELQRARAAGRNVGASDGFKLDARGNVFASAIDSVFVFGPRFEALLGRIVVGDKIGNVAFGGREGNELFIAANSRILRVKTLTKGSFYPAQ